VKDPLEEASADVDRRGATFGLVIVLVGLVLLAVVHPSARDALVIIAGIILMVMLHEAGHYITAKRAGMKVTEFFLGFGPRLWSFKRGETEYGVKAIPAGGYVRIVGMSNLEEVDPADEPRTFRNASYKHRLTVILAGVTVNALLAFVLFAVALAGRGQIPDGGANTHLNAIVKHSVASAAGFKAGDRVTAVDGKHISTWDQLKHAITAHAGRTATFTVLRHGETIQIVATPKLHDDGHGRLGVANPDSTYRSVSVLGSVPESFKLMGTVTTGTFDVFANLFSPSGVANYSKNFTTSTKGLPTAGNDRPRSIIGIVDLGSQIAHGDVWVLLFLLGNISLAFALINLIPLLPFDGGHAAVVVYEMVASKIKRRKVQVDYRHLMPVAVIVLAVFLLLGLSAMFLDIKQAVGS
jgi:membrane-associated protease RseP (regulator of RpoE activity)